MIGGLSGFNAMTALTPGVETSPVQQNAQAYAGQQHRQRQSVERATQENMHKVAMRQIEQMAQKAESAIANNEIQRGLDELKSKFSLLAQLPNNLG
ncbi:hypothetical protein [Ensifer sp. SL37]|uniref:hypothetical protein n=1 Tax=Ensifer sp. SL37 TaxID=2995137 RepID=UPI00227464D9|nr:hypothetical protein [Ensifer sp. SL37]MCY1740809.1 hypothetical protein [Ensifer sp. SL37]MCY1740816.1 hypothetical protein [Ensifer sp. SL37]